MPVTSIRLPVGATPKNLRVPGVDNYNKQLTGATLFILVASEP
jgi:hypothetical protein